MWLAELEKANNLQGAHLRIFQGTDQSGEMAEKLSGKIKAGILEDLYVKNEKLIQNKDERIRFLEDEIAKIKVKNVPFKELSDELRINYDGLETFSYSNKITTNFQKTDTLPVINIRWKDGVSTKDKKANARKIAEWLKYKMKLDTIRVVEYP
jgi:hypothetical protein